MMAFPARPQIVKIGGRWRSYASRTEQWSRLGPEIWSFEAGSKKQ